VLVASSPYAFHLHPDVLALLGAIVGGYVVALRVAAPRHAPDPARAASRLQVVMFGAGVFTLGLALGWPVHDIAEDHLFAFHMVQHMLIMLVAAPLLLLGTPGWMLRWVLGPGVALRAFRWLSRPPIAFLVSNVMTVLLHVPPVIQIQVESYPAHVAFHQAMLLSGLLMWMPVLSPLPEIRRLSRPAQMLYLFLQSLLPTIPTSFLTFSERPLYGFYETTERLWGITPVDDQMIAGLLMKIAGGMLLWAAITVIFFVWQADEERGDKRQRQRAAEWDSLVRSFREEATVR
jgi:putative membrane protein